MRFELQENLTDHDMGQIGEGGKKKKQDYRSVVYCSHSEGGWQHYQCGEVVEGDSIYFNIGPVEFADELYVQAKEGKKTRVSDYSNCEDGGTIYLDQKE